MRIMPVNATDFYKTGHRAQYPAGTSFVYSNFTPRSHKWAPVAPGYDGKVVFFGLQGVCQTLLIDLWNEQFFDIPREFVIQEYKHRIDSSLGVGAVPTDHIAALHDLGYLPVLIKALPEGSRVNTRVPLWTIQNTHPDFFWVTNYLETQLSAELWKMLTTATIAYEYRRTFERYARETGAPLDFVMWQGHDFSMRGMSGIYDASTSGAAHLLSFYGTDTIPAIDYLENYYGAEGLIGGSVPATEHSVMCMGGADDEIGTFSRLINQAYPAGIVSIVSDTWDFWRVITEFAATLKRDIMARNGKVVFRPDSGDPVKIVVGDPEAEPGSPAHKGAIECLWDIFGGTTTPEGYRMLDPHVGLIYGDSITLERAEAILGGLKLKGFASNAMVFGIGSFTYQHSTRDSFGTAIKATFGVVNGEDRVLFKAPKTDSGEKNSARGLLRVEKVGSDFVLHELQSREQESQGLLQPVFKDSVLLREETLAEIRERLAGDLTALAQAAE